MNKLNFYILNSLEEISDKVFKILDYDVYRNSQNNIFYIFAIVMCVTDNTFFEVIIEEEYNTKPNIISFIPESSVSLI